MNKENPTTDLLMKNKTKMEQYLIQHLLDVLYQSCGEEKNGKCMIDDRATSAYEDACEFLTELGFLKRRFGGMMYEVRNKKKQEEGKNEKCVFKKV